MDVKTNFSIPYRKTQAVGFGLRPAGKARKNPWLRELVHYLPKINPWPGERGPASIGGANTTSESPGFDPFAAEPVAHGEEGLMSCR
jgi:hypothetical protein